MPFVFESKLFDPRLMRTFRTVSDLSHFYDPARCMERRTIKCSIHRDVLLDNGPRLVAEVDGVHSCTRIYRVCSPYLSVHYTILQAVRLGKTLVRLNMPNNVHKRFQRFFSGEPTVSI